MGTIVYSTCCLSWKNSQQKIPFYHVDAHYAPKTGCSITKAVVACSRENGCVDEESERFSGFLKRRSAIVSGVSLISSAVLGFQGEGLAVVKQGLLAGRVPGLSEPDEQGWLSWYFALVHESILFLFLSYFRFYLGT